MSRLRKWISGSTVVLRMADTSAPYEFAWDTRDYFNGARKLELRAMDMNGRQGSSGVRTVQVGNPSTAVRVFSPGRSDIAFGGLPYTITWGVSQGTSTVLRFDVELSSDGGKSFVPIDGCGNLPAAARECVWNAPGPVTKKAVVRLTGIDSAGESLKSDSDLFAVRSGTTQIELKSPNKPVRWGIGSRQSIAWSSGIGEAAALRLELSRDGGASWSTLAPRLAYAQDFLWTVTGPSTTKGLVRLTWLHGPLSDTNDSMFVIEEPSLELSAPSAAAEWTCGAAVKVKWTTNLGLRDRLIVRLSTRRRYDVPARARGEHHCDAASGRDRGAGGRYRGCRGARGVARHPVLAGHRAPVQGSLRRMRSCSRFSIRSDSSRNMSGLTCLA